MSDTHKTKAQLREEVNSLRQSEERYRGILDGLLEGFQVIDHDWRHLYVNEAAARHRRRKREELLGRTMTEVFPGIEETALFAAMRTAMNTQTPHRMEHEFFFPDGSSTWLELMIQPVPEGISILSIDITGRKRAAAALSDSKGRLRQQTADSSREQSVSAAALSDSKGRLRQQTASLEAVRESERKFRTLVENLPQKVFLKDENSTYVMCNEIFARDLGIRAEEFGGKSDFDFFPKEMAEKYRADDREVMAAGKIVEIEEKYLVDGKESWVQTLKVPMHDESGNTSGLLGVFWDITDRKQTEEEIRRNARELDLRNRIAEVFLTERGEEIYARVLDIIREEFGSEYGVFGYIDEKGGLVVPTMTRGVWNQCEVPDKRIVFPRDIWGRSSWPTAIREKRVISSNEPSTVTPEGHITITRHISQPIIHLGEVIGLIQVANKDSDYTDEDIKLLQTISGAIAPVLYARMMQERHDARLREVMDDLARSNQELEQFAYVASHDLQEPLRMVASYTQLLERRYKDQLDETANEFIGYAVEGANRMQRLIQDLLAYSRVTSRGQGFAEANLEEVLAEAKANLQAAIEETSAEITSDPLPVVKADYSQMLQLLQNLIGNAVKFHGEEPPRVRISVEEKPAEWVFSVRDNGIGIDSQYFDRVFVIFQRLGGRADYAGTGIGLALSRRIVHRHGGSIWIESEPGKGSTFCFSLPKRR